MTKVMKTRTAFITFFSSFRHIAYIHKIFSSKSFWKKVSLPFKMLINYCSLWQVWASFMTKLMKRPTVFIIYFRNSSQVAHPYKILSSQVFFKKKGRSLEMLRKCYSLEEMFTIFAVKLMKRPTTFFTRF